MTPVVPEEGALDVRCDEHPDGPVVRVSGELDLRSAPQLRTVLWEAVGSLEDRAEAGRRVVLDVRELAYADSVGLTVLVAGHHRAQSSGGELVIRDPQGPVRRVLDVCGLLDVLAVEEGWAVGAPEGTAEDVDGSGASAVGGPDAGVVDDPEARDRPRHLLVWLTGRGDGSDQPVALDDELRPGFSLPDWLAGVHDGYPDALTAVVLDGTADTGRAVAELVDDRSTARFRGDTTPTSLGELRRWAADAAHGLVDDGDAGEVVERAVLVASELAANVERHAPGWLLVDLAPFDGSVLVAVTDSRPVVLPRPDQAHRTDGWRGGLDVVRAVSSATGLLTGPSTKTVWAVVGR